MKACTFGSVWAKDNRPAQVSWCQCNRCKGIKEGGMRCKLLSFLRSKWTVQQTRPESLSRPGCTAECIKYYIPSPRKRKAKLYNPQKERREFWECYVKEQWLLHNLQCQKREMLQTASDIYQGWIKLVAHQTWFWQTVVSITSSCCELMHYSRRIREADPSTHICQGYD